MPTLIQDTFTAEDGTLLTDRVPDVNTPGSSWLAIRGASLQIHGGKATRSGSGTGNGVLIDAGVADCVISVEVVLGSGGTNAAPGIWCRYAGITDSGYYVRYNRSAGALEIVYQLGSGVIATTPVSIPDGTAFTLSAELAGNTITATISGGASATVSVESSAYLSDTMHGILSIDNGTAVDNAYDNFQIVVLDDHTVSHPRIVQRTGPTGPLSINGFCGESTSKVQSRIILAADSSEVVPWTDVATDVSGSEWAGSLPVPTGGPYYAEVRFLDSSDEELEATSGANTFIVGDVFAALGQSNTVGSGIHDQTYTGGNVAWLIRGNNPIDETLNDPWSNTDKGGGWGVLLANLIDAYHDSQVPLAFLVQAEITTGLVDESHWLPPSGAQWQLANAMVSASGVNGIRAVLWLQGERDARNGVSSEDYESAEKSLAAAVAQWPGAPRVISSLIGYNADSPTQINAIRQAKIANWDDGTTAAGANPIDIDLADEGGDGLHFKTDAELAALAARIWLSLENLVYGGSNGRGPRLMSAVRDGSDVLLTFDRDLQGDSYATTAFQVDAVTIVAATKTSERVITLTCEGEFGDAPTVSFGLGNSAAGVAVPASLPIALPAEIHSIAEMSLPAEPIYGVAVEDEPPVLASITVSPATVSVAAGGTQQFTATQRDQYGDPVDAGPVEWSVDGEGTIDQEGLYTAPATETTDEVSAMRSGIIGSAIVNVSVPSPDPGIMPPPSVCELTLRVASHAGVPLAGERVVAKLPDGYVIASDTLVINTAQSQTTNQEGLVTLGLVRNQEYELQVVRKSQTVRIKVLVPDEESAALGMAVTN